MSATPILITVRDRNQAYHCRHNGVSASSTSHPGAAAQRLADKVFGEGTHRVRMVRDCRSGEPGEWAIEPLARIWRPHTEQPASICTAVIAIRCKLDSDDREEHVLLPKIFMWAPGVGWTDESHDAPMPYREFFWLPEADLLAPLETATATQGVEQ